MWKDKGARKPGVDKKLEVAKNRVRVLEGGAKDTRKNSGTKHVQMLEVGRGDPLQLNQGTLNVKGNLSQIQSVEL